MTMSNERIKILKMVEEGKITAEEAAGLIKALSGLEKPKPKSSGTEKGWLRIQVTDIESGEPSVNVNLPLRLVNVGLKLGARFVPEMEDFDVDELAEALRSGLTGKVMDVIDEEEGTKVEIFVE